MGRIHDFWFRYRYQAQDQGYTVSLLRSRKTYSRYLKKLARPKMPQYFASGTFYSRGVRAVAVYSQGSPSTRILPGTKFSKFDLLQLYSCILAVLVNLVFNPSKFIIGSGYILLLIIVI
eukprot:SAG11_NODE_4_length_33019_cov_28.098909_35_plen_119_part_00